MSSSFISEKAMVDALRARLNNDMLKAAEPVLQEALAKVEREMRASLAKNVVALIESTVDVYRDGRYLMIRINRE